MSSKLSHLDARGQAHMVDVSAKKVTAREAVAEAVVVLSQAAFAAVMEETAPKGDVLAAARIAGILAAKKVPDLIPLCHPIAIAKAEVDFEPEPGQSAIRIRARVATSGQTGVEMEALTAVSVAALTLYDMIKSVDKGAMIETVRLIAKSGGKSGNYQAPSKPSPNRNNNRPKAQTLMGEVASPRPHPDRQRDAFRIFMASHRLRPTLWAKQAGIASGEILSFLTGRSPALSPEAAEKLARAARVRVEDMFK
jgi:cyclic pyranopterin monophosphate synthase